MDGGPSRAAGTVRSLLDRLRSSTRRLRRGHQCDEGLWEGPRTAGRWGWMRDCGGEHSAPPARAGTRPNRRRLGGACRTRPNHRRSGCPESAPAALAHSRRAIEGTANPGSRPRHLNPLTTRTGRNQERRSAFSRRGSSGRPSSVVVLFCGDGLPHGLVAVRGSMRWPRQLQGGRSGNRPLSCRSQATPRAGADQASRALLAALVTACVW